MSTVEGTARVANAFCDLILIIDSRYVTRDIRYQPISRKEIMQDPLKRRNRQFADSFKNTVPQSTV